MQFVTVYIVGSINLNHIQNQGVPIYEPRSTSWASIKPQSTSIKLKRTESVSLLSYCFDACFFYDSLLKLTFLDYPFGKYTSSITAQKKKKKNQNKKIYNANINDHSQQMSFILIYITIVCEIKSYCKTHQNITAN